MVFFGRRNTAQKVIQKIYTLLVDCVYTGAILRGCILYMRQGINLLLRWRIFWVGVAAYRNSRGAGGHLHVRLAATWVSRAENFSPQTEKKK